MASKSYQASETSTVWTDATTGGDKLFDFGGIVNSTGQCGAYLDLGASPRADVYELVVVLDGHASAPTLDSVFEIFITESNATTGFDGQLTTDPTDIAEGAVSLNQARMNCRFLGEIKTVSANAADILQKRFVFRTSARYIAPIILNVSGTSLKTTADSHTMTLTPIPQEGQ